ncbi:neurofibromin [Anaeramoeba flamelloides]|uniref:Neurofibromin n=1 Tax=Anaeramoeba flamelloides TaxID=1746091 RepID=A0AAV7Z2Q0_9EUKA|nr:neurofibromin [Anaeramoeba flamelloides]
MNVYPKFSYYSHDKKKLTFYVDDKIVLDKTNKTDRDWLIGTNTRTNKTGKFPKHYVSTKPIPLPESFILNRSSLEKQLLKFTFPRVFKTEHLDPETKNSGLGILNLDPPKKIPHYPFFKDSFVLISFKEGKWNPYWIVLDGKMLKLYEQELTVTSRDAISVFDFSELVSISKISPKTLSKSKNLPTKSKLNFDLNNKKSKKKNKSNSLRNEYQQDPYLSDNLKNTDPEQKLHCLRLIFPNNNCFLFMTKTKFELHAWFDIFHMIKLLSSLILRPSNEEDSPLIRLVLHYLNNLKKEFSVSSRSLKRIINSKNLKSYLKISLIEKVKLTQLCLNSIQEWFNLLLFKLDLSEHFSLDPRQRVIVLNDSNNNEESTATTTTTTNKNNNNNNNNNKRNQEQEEEKEENDEIIKDKKLNRQDEEEDSDGDNSDEINKENILKLKKYEYIAIIQSIEEDYFWIGEKNGEIGWFDIRKCKIVLVNESKRINNKKKHNFQIKGNRQIEKELIVKEKKKKKRKNEPLNGWRIEFSGILFQKIQNKKLKYNNSNNNNKNDQNNMTNSNKGNNSNTANNKKNNKKKMTIKNKKKHWEKRWCLLSGVYLFIYLDETSSQPNEIIDLREINSILNCSKEYNREYSFKFLENEKEMIFSAEDQNRFEIWTNIFELIIDMFQVLSLRITMLFRSEHLQRCLRLIKYIRGQINDSTMLYNKLINERIRYKKKNLKFDKQKVIKFGTKENRLQNYFFFNPYLCLLEKLISQCNETIIQRQTFNNLISITGRLKFPNLKIKEVGYCIQQHTIINNDTNDLKVRRNQWCIILQEEDEMKFRISIGKEIGTVPRNKILIVQLRNRDLVFDPNEESIQPNQNNDMSLNKTTYNDGVDEDEDDVEKIFDDDDDDDDDDHDHDHDHDHDDEIGDKNKSEDSDSIGSNFILDEMEKITNLKEKDQFSLNKRLSLQPIKQNVNSSNKLLLKNQKYFQNTLNYNYNSINNGEDDDNNNNDDDKNNDDDDQDDDSDQNNKHNPLIELYQKNEKDKKSGNHFPCYKNSYLKIKRGKKWIKYYCKLNSLFFGFYENKESKLPISAIDFRKVIGFKNINFKKNQLINKKKKKKKNSYFNSNNNNNNNNNNNQNNKNKDVFEKKKKKYEQFNLNQLKNWRKLILSRIVRLTIENNNDTRLRVYCNKSNYNNNENNKKINFLKGDVFLYKGKYDDQYYKILDNNNNNNKNDFEDDHEKDHGFFQKNKDRDQKKNKFKNDDNDNEDDDDYHEKDNVFIQKKQDQDQKKKKSKNNDNNNDDDDDDDGYVYYYDEEKIILINSVELVKPCNSSIFIKNQIDNNNSNNSNNNDNNEFLSEIGEVSTLNTKLFNELQNQNICLKFLQNENNNNNSSSNNNNNNNNNNNVNNYNNNNNQDNNIKKTKKLKKKYLNTKKKIFNKYLLKNKITMKTFNDYLPFSFEGTILQELLKNESKRFIKKYLELDSWFLFLFNENLICEQIYDLHNLIKIEKSNDLSNFKNGLILFFKNNIEIRIILNTKSQLEKWFNIFWLIENLNYIMNPFEKQYYNQIFLRYIYMIQYFNEQLIYLNKIQLSISNNSNDSILADFQSDNTYGSGNENSGKSGRGKRKKKNYFDKDKKNQLLLSWKQYLISRLCRLSIIQKIHNSNYVSGIENVNQNLRIDFRPRIFTLINYSNDNEDELNFEENEFYLIIEPQKNNNDYLKVLDNFGNIKKVDFLKVEQVLPETIDMKKEFPNENNRRNNYQQLKNSIPLNNQIKQGNTTANTNLKKSKMDHDINNPSIEIPPYKKLQYINLNYLSKKIAIIYSLNWYKLWQKNYFDDMLNFPIHYSSEILIKSKKLNKKINRWLVIRSWILLIYKSHSNFQKPIIVYDLRMLKSIKIKIKKINNINNSSSNSGNNSSNNSKDNNNSNVHNNTKNVRSGKKKKKNYFYLILKFFDNKKKKLNLIFNNEYYLNLCKENLGAIQNFINFLTPPKIEGENELLKIESLELLLLWINKSINNLQTEMIIQENLRQLYEGYDNEQIDQNVLNSHKETERQINLLKSWKIRILGKIARIKFFKEFISEKIKMIAYSHTATTLNKNIAKIQGLLTFKEEEWILIPDFPHYNHQLNQFDPFIGIKKNQERGLVDPIRVTLLPLHEVEQKILFNFNELISDDNNNNSVGGGGGGDRNGRDGDDRPSKLLLPIKNKGNLLILNENLVNTKWKGKKCIVKLKCFNLRFYKLNKKNKKTEKKNFMNKKLNLKKINDVGRIIEKKNIPNLSSLKKEYQNNVFEIFLKNQKKSIKFCCNSEKSRNEWIQIFDVLRNFKKIIKLPSKINYDPTERKINFENIYFWIENWIHKYQNKIIKLRSKFKLFKYNSINNLNLEKLANIQKKIDKHSNYLQLLEKWKIKCLRRILRLMINNENNNNDDKDKDNDNINNNDNKDDDDDDFKEDKDKSDDDDDDDDDDDEIIDSNRNDDEARGFIINQTIGKKKKIVFKKYQWVKIIKNNAKNPLIKIRNDKNQLDNIYRNNILIIRPLQAEKFIEDVIIKENLTNNKQKGGKNSSNDEILNKQRQEEFMNLLFVKKLLITRIWLKLVNVADSELFSRSFVKVFESKNKTMLLIDQAIDLEVSITKSPSQLFRGNSISPRIISAYAKIIGRQYIIQTIKPIVQAMIQENNDEDENDNFEIVPFKIQNNEDKLLRNQQRLIKYIKIFLNTIIENIYHCPIQLRVIAWKLCKATEGKFENSKQVVLSGFFFLRLFCPAIVVPFKYGILDKPVDKEIRRGLVLISKVLQNVANKSGFKDSSMLFMNDLFEELSPIVFHFLELFSKRIFITESIKFDKVLVLGQKKEFYYVRPLKKISRVQSDSGSGSGSVSGSGSGSDEKKYLKNVDYIKVNENDLKLENIDFNIKFTKYKISEQEFQISLNEIFQMLKQKQIKFRMLEMLQIYPTLKERLLDLIEEDN